ncbi:MAG: nitronate monooxygenase [Bradyrhizobium sp.]
MSLPDPLQNLVLPVIAAPLFIVSGPELVIAECKAGVVGTFPSLNARTPDELRARLVHIEKELGSSEGKAAPYGVNLICHRTNQRLAVDTDIVVEHRVPVVITSGGDPRPIVDRVRPYGGLVFADVTDLKWARKAAAAGVDGLILVCGGAGGHAGLMNPFALLPQVREFYLGMVILAGAISDGRAIRAAEVLGADMVYIGTRFIATAEANASKRYKDMLIESQASDLIYTDVFSGLHANMLRPSIREFGLDPDNLPARNALNISKELNPEVRAWRDVWSAGQGVGSIHDVPTVAELVNRMRAEYEEAACVPREPFAERLPGKRSLAGS